MAFRTLYFERLALFLKYTFCFKFGETFIALLILCFKMVIYISQCNCLTKIIKSSKCCIKKDFRRKKEYSGIHCETMVDNYPLW